MVIRKEILLFVISLSVLHIWDILLLNYSIIGGNTWAVLFYSTMACCIYFASRLISEFEFENAYFKAVFILLMFYHIITIGRGIVQGYADIKILFQTEYLIWPFIIPMFVFFDKKIDTLVELLKVMFYLGIVFLIASLVYPDLIINRTTAETIIHPFAFGAGFLLLNARYLSKKKALICLLVCMVAVLSFTYLARRNAIITFSGFILASLFLYIKDLSFAKLIKLIPIVAGIVVLTVSFSDEIPSSLTSRLAERVLEDSRSDVFGAFYKGMSDDMAFGKGLNGTYYCPFNETVLEDGTPVAEAVYRNGIENGYLQLILSGGYVEIALFVLVLLPAAYLGVFRSSNSFSRASGILIALWLIDMSIYGLPRLILQYIFVWIAVGICYKTSFRKMPEDQIYAAFENIGLT